MKNLKIILVLAFIIASASSCGRKDRCPTVGSKVNTVQRTAVA